MFNPYKFISNKKNGVPHTPNEITQFITGLLNKDYDPTQMAAWLMAVCFKGMNQNELIEYVNCIINSGDQVDFNYLDEFVVDKHSTGGVGDKVSLIAGPILAACGCYVPMVVGRSLAHTGGTLDKLESIQGYSGDISINEFKRNVELNKISIIGQNEYICPADKYIYSIRDITSTIECLPLICASIISKKKAEGSQALVLDIKLGNGAFMKSISDAKELGDALVQLAEDLSISTKYIISDMNQPLGIKSGLWCEIKESIDFLKNNYRDKNLNTIVFKICSIALKMKGEKNPRSLIENAISSGNAYEVFEKMIKSHGGSLKNSESINQAKYSYVFKSTKQGYINKMDTEQLGYMLLELGGGRKKQNDKLDSSCGFKIYKKINDPVEKGEPIIKIFGSNQNKIEQIKEIFPKVINIDNKLGKTPLMIYN